MLACLCDSWLSTTYVGVCFSKATVWRLPAILWILRHRRLYKYVLLREFFLPTFYMICRRHLREWGGGGGVPSTRQVIRCTRKSHYQTFVTISVFGIGIRNSFTEAPQRVGAHAPLSKHASEIGNPVVQLSNQNMKQWTPGNNTNAYRWRCYRYYYRPVLPLELRCVPKCAVTPLPHKNLLHWDCCYIFLLFIFLFFC